MARRIKGGQMIRYHLGNEWRDGKIKEVCRESKRYRVILNPGDLAGEILRWFSRKEIRIKKRD